MIPIPYTLKGSCTHCGVCCDKLISIRMRKNNDPNNACKFLFKSKGKFYCKIMAQETSLFELTDFQLNFYTSNCLDYPNPNKDYHWDESLPKKCTYWRELIDPDS